MNRSTKFLAAETGVRICPVFARELTATTEGGKKRTRTKMDAGQKEETWWQGTTDRRDKSAVAAAVTSTWDVDSRHHRERFRPRGVRSRTGLVGCSVPACRLATNNRRLLVFGGEATQARRIGPMSPRRGRIGNPQRKRASAKHEYPQLAPNKPSAPACFVATLSGGQGVEFRSSAFRASMMLDCPAV